MEINYHSYDYILIAYSGGKDSTCLLLHLLDLGVDMSTVELHHHLVDGRGETFMDWPVTESYCRAIAKSFGVPLYFSWREGGFKREMLREEERTGAVFFETPEGKLRKVGGNNGSPNTRRKFPQQSADLRVRWCSSYTKISVLDVAIANQERFKGKRTLVLTGERAEESAARAKYAEFEPHRKHTKSRHVDHARPLLHWSTTQVWEKMRQYRVIPHPAYYLSFGRCSCMGCIFISDEDWATLLQIAPERVRKIAYYEKAFGSSIQRPAKGKDWQDHTVLERAKNTKPRFVQSYFVKLSQSTEWEASVILADDLPWIVPSGAYADLSGGSP